MYTILILDMCYNIVYIACIHCVQYMHVVYYCMRVGVDWDVG